VILDVHGEAAIGGIETGTASDGPALEYAIELQAKIVVEAPCGVLLHDEAVAVAVDDLGPRLRRPVEAALAFVPIEGGGS
jgi:hypothetical protein